MTFARRILLAIVVCLCVAGIAGAKKRRHRKPPAKKVLETASGPLTLRLETVDIDSARAVVLVTGVAREPEARLFTLHDDKDRHFIALDAKCEAAGPSTMRCTLGLPRPYLRGRIVAMTVHLKNREVEAPAAEVDQIFTAARARAATTTTTQKPIPDGGAPPASAPDGGATAAAPSHTSSFFDAPGWRPPTLAGDGGWSHEPVGEDTEEWQQYRHQDTER